MNKEATVFITGAGLSCCYNFPTGVQLKDIIYKSTIRPQKFTPFLINQIGIKATDLSYFAENFKYSRCFSIDQFIALRKNNNSYVKLSKYLVAKNILDHENVELLMNISSKPHPYDILWNRMIYSNGKLIDSPDDFKALNVKFLTFNYDRSLEYFLFEACRATFNIDHKKAYKLVEDLDIIHVYGSLLENPKNLEKSFSSVPYAMKVHNDKVYELCEKMNFMRVTDPKTEHAESISIIENSKNIVFLGFGFDEFNLGKFGKLNLKNKRVYASGLNITEARRKSIGGRLKKQILWEEKCDECLSRAFLNIN